VRGVQRYPAKESWSLPRRRGRSSTARACRGNAAAMRATIPGGPAGLGQGRRDRRLARREGDAAVRSRRAAAPIVGAAARASRTGATRDAGLPKLRMPHPRQRNLIISQLNASSRRPNGSLTKPRAPRRLSLSGSRLGEMALTWPAWNQRAADRLLYWYGCPATPRSPWAEPLTITTPAQTMRPVRSSAKLLQFGDNQPGKSGPGHPPRPSPLHGGPGPCRPARNSCAFSLEEF
jgi:hypothetical protein